MSKPDELERIFETTEKRLRDNGILTIRGLLTEPENGEFHRVTFDNEPSSEACVEFVEKAKLLGAKYVVVQQVRLTEEDLEESVVLCEAFRPDGKGGADAKALLLKELKEAHSNVGKLAAVYFEFLGTDPSVLFSLSFRTPWYSAVFDPESQLEVTEAQDEKQELTDEEVDAFAARTASNEEAKHMMTFSHVRPQDWLGLATRVLGTDLPKRLTQDSYDNLAAAIEATFENDIRPGLEAQLGLKARKLLEQGMKKSEVAIRLNVSVQKLTRYIVRADELKE